MPDPAPNPTSESPAPLRDRTNDASPTVAELEAKVQEIAHLKGLVNGFTKSKGRGRKKRVRDDEQGTPAKKTKDAETPTDYIGYGRTIGRFLGPFANISQVIEYGCTMDSAMSGDEAETDEHLAEAWRILWQKFPGFHEFLLSLSTQPVARS